MASVQQSAVLDPSRPVVDRVPSGTCDYCKQVAGVRQAWKDDWDGYHPGCQCTPAPEWDDVTVVEVSGDQARDLLLQAGEHALHDLGINLVDLAGLDPRTGGMVASEISKIYEQFPELKGHLLEVAAGDLPKNVVAEYTFGLRRMTLNRESFADLDELAQLSAERYLAGDWSTGTPGRAIWHEMGHALADRNRVNNIAFGMDTDMARLSKVKAIRSEAVQSLQSFASHLPTQTQREAAARKWARDNVSLYGIKDKTVQEFIAESFAEFENGNPRSWARRVIEAVR
jgi:hypothetical protein